MSIDEETVEEWGGELRVIQARIGPYFERQEARERAIRYLKGLLSDVPRKNGWQLAEQAGETTPDGMQRLLSTAVWDVAAVRDELGSYVVENLGEAEASLVVDETGFPKQGQHSAGVKRQYSGTLGKVANCQIGVFLTYASRRGHALLDRELYLPQDWTDDRARCQASGIPETVSFATKPELARRMIERAMQQSVPFAWVSGDTVYGGAPAFRQWLADRQVSFVLALAKDDRLWDGERPVRADELAANLPADAWQRLSCGQGAKGPRLYDWALRVLPSTDQGATHFQALLVRRSLSNGELAYFVVFAPTGTPLQRLVNVAGQRWTVEEGFELGKDEVGLDQYEVRHWRGWYRHITLAMWALAYLTVTKYQATQSTAPKKRSRAG